MWKIVPLWNVSVPPVPLDENSLITTTLMEYFSSQLDGLRDYLIQETDFFELVEALPFRLAL